MKSFFSTTKKHIPKGLLGVLQRKVDKWSHEEVRRWLNNVGLARYGNALKERGVQGPELLKLSQLDVYELASSGEDASRFLAELAVLHKREGTCANLSQGATSTPSSAYAGSGSTANSTRPSSGSQGTGGRESSPGDGSAALLEGLSDRLAALGIAGTGLEVAAQGSPLVTPIIRALWELHERATEAKGFRAACLHLDSYVRSILTVFDAEGKRLAALGGGPLRKLLGLLQEATTLVESCCDSGWLARMLAGEKVESFIAVHNAVLQLLKDERLDVLPNGSHLTFGSYAEESRPLKRALKQVGGGSVEGGLAAVQTNDQAMRELVTVLDVDSKIILKELQESGLLSEEAAAAAVASPKAATATATFAKTASAQGPGAEFAKEYQQIFSQYDKHRRGTLNAEEFRSVLTDLGILDGIPSGQLQDERATQQFRQADVDRSGSISLDEFVAYYHTSCASRARLELRSSLGPSAERDLQKVFCSFASFGGRQHVEDMEGSKFAKLCRDSKLLSRAFTASDVDLFFAKVKTKGARRITFGQFAEALALVAAKTNSNLADVASAVLAADGPSVTGTKAEYVKFHDDKSTYTGVYKKGGPSTVEPSKDLSALLDRSPADIRGIKKSVIAQQGGSPLTNADSSPAAAAGNAPRRPPSINTTVLTNPAHGSGSYVNSPASTAFGAGLVSPPSASSGSSQAAGHKHVLPPTPDSARPNDRIKAVWDNVADEELHAAFRAFAIFGAGGTPKSGAAGPKAPVLDSGRFVKLVRDSGLLDGRLTATSVELIFSKVKGQGARKIEFAAFEKTLPLLAKEKGVSAEEVRRAIVLSGGPHRNTLVTPDFVRLHDDKSTFTGVYAKGGPSTVDKKITLATITNRATNEKGMIL
ncbi:p25-alpha-domain-containing protein [Coccomyxa subellipsoidea C-169]|uniref:P25-alpha-domain-containing protein n=1 Tax=Coccomyxa subellipsoidea (strain C-169) TaxID=574566 RepID=I0Z2Z7_COCSC|nr:p25-alpha-domain-containing protein [Coccomyxa subellipsoidea C-169]EIE25016.1 p25-alpha-domain-containing protein [Coccomyxa subellipsoidea C-169]|eukprot:XP_005649560.1 p25-alpha-domain-containing protein [Coccomyxa subellipsoidea C-169]